MSTMKVIQTIREFRAERGNLGGEVGFVPTMGYLHEGHLTLVRRARQENAAVVVSIFVNPTQFGQGEDFGQYPRDLERDLTMLRQEGVDIVFNPDGEEMYPPRFNSWVEVQGITECLEGARRPGHFKGVATVVTKLFNVVQSDRAYFGQKDAQQVAVIKKMVADLNMGLEIVVVPTVREPDGLAMSSRNTYLSESERQAALVLWKALTLGQKQHSKGNRSASDIRLQMESLINSEPLADVDYISIADPDSLEELTDIEGAALISMAVRVGKTRLIDNLIVGISAEDVE